MARNLKLYLKIIEKYGTCNKFAEVLGVSPATLSNKINGKTPITTDDVYKFSEELDIPKTRMFNYFPNKII